MRAAVTGVAGAWMKMPTASPSLSRLMLARIAFVSLPSRLTGRPQAEHQQARHRPFEQLAFRHEMDLARHRYLATGGLGN